MDQKDLLLAQNHILKGKVEPNGQYNFDTLLEEQEKSAYDKVYKNLSEKTSITSLVDSYISEKSYDTENLNNEKNNILNENIENHKIRDEISRTMENINEIIMKFKIDKVAPLDYQNEYKKSKNYKIEPSMTQKKMNQRIRGISKKSYKF